MKACLNTMTLGSHVPLDKALDAASKAGFQGVEIFSIETSPGYPEAEAAAELASQLASLSLEPVGFILGGFVYESEADFRANLAKREERMAFAHSIGADNGLLFIPSKGKLSDAEALRTAGRNVAAICRAADKHGIKVGLEPIGKADFLNTPASVLRLIQNIDHDNLGLTVDFFHFHTAGCSLRDLDAIPAEAIFLIHIDDAPSAPIAQLDDSMRVLPGQGGLDVVGFIRALHRIGYTGHLSVELFNRDLWAKDPLVAAKASRSTLHDVMNEAGIEG